MPQPTSGAMYVNELLTNVSVGWMQRPEKFVAMRAFARVPVQRESARYAEFDRGDMLRDEMAVRGPSAESAGTGYRVSTTPYHCEVWALHKDVDNRDRTNAMRPFNPDRDAARFLAQKALIKMDVEWAAAFGGTGLWTGSTTGSDLTAGTEFGAFDDVSSTPIETVSEQQVEVESNTGFLPNVLVVNRRGWIALKNHPDIVDRVKHTNPNAITTEQVARLMDLDEILVASAVRNTAQEGEAASVDYIFGNHAVLLYRTSTPAIDEPSSGYVFAWEGLEGSTDGVTVSTIDMPLKKATRHEIETAFDMKVVAPITGVAFRNVVS